MAKKFLYVMAKSDREMSGKMKKFQKILKKFYITERSENKVLYK